MEIIRFIFLEAAKFWDWYFWEMVAAKAVASLVVSKAWMKTALYAVILAVPDWGRGFRQRCGGGSFTCGAWQQPGARRLGEGLNANAVQARE